MVTGQIESAEVRSDTRRSRSCARGAHTRVLPRKSPVSTGATDAPTPPITAPPPPLPPPPAPLQFRGLDNLFCRYTFSYGPDWRILQGIDHGFSQVAQKGASSSAAGGGGGAVVWNFPIDVTFKTTNPHGWPRVVVSVYSQVRPRGAPESVRDERERFGTLTPPSPTPTPHPLGF
jgi:hypothetical protein